ncbi:MAG: SDR family NAD(P)-dependent oxidoreductase [Halobacteriales archaeon]
MTRGSSSLDESIVVVTGGTRGIGLAIAEAFAAEGATVVPTSRTESAVESAVEVVRERGVDSLAITTDVSDPESVDSFFDAVDDAFGRLDVLVNNAGINPRAGMGRPGDVEKEALDRTVDVNFRGAFNCVRAAEDPLHEDDGGAVVNVASISGLVGTPRQHPYTASKHALVGLTKSLALDWAPTVRVNALAPGYVSTELTEPLKANEELYRSVIDRTPMGRFAEPEEIADAALYIASDRASFVTGSVLTVDGGWTAR